VRAALCAEALSWVGVPFLHQGRTRAGVDCIGFVAAVGIAVGLIAAGVWSLPGALKYAGYGRNPDGRLRQGLDEHFPACAVPEPGSIVLMEYRDAQPQHLGILVAHPMGGEALVHALRRGVRAHRLDERWRSRIVAAYDYPGAACS
jgi:cell wall-associated NlpC family hydrolase